MPQSWKVFLPENWVVINAAAALVAAGVVGNFVEGADLAGKMLLSGAAGDKLSQLVKFTKGPG